MKLEIATEAVRASERALAATLAALPEHHRGDHDVFHMAHTLHRIATANLERLDAPDDGAPAALTGDLLHDLRELHVLYATASIDWVVLGQGARATRSSEWLDVVGACHPQTLRGLKWTVTRIKVAAPQVLAS